MGAIRYCGKVKISCSYVDVRGEYICRLSLNGKRIVTERIGEPKSLRGAVDSPSAFDSTAHAALSFAVDDGRVDESDLDFTNSGFLIRRRK